MAGEMKSAENGLAMKLAGSLFGPAYQGIQTILLAAVAGVDIKFGVSDMITGKVGDEHVLACVCSLPACELALSPVSFDVMRWPAFTSVYGDEPWSLYVVHACLVLFRCDTDRPPLAAMGVRQG